MDALATILARVGDDDALDAVDRIFAEDWREDYAGMLQELRSTAPAVSALTILISPDHNVWGIEPSNSEAMAIEFVPWAEWLSMAVDRSLIPDASDADIIAYCIAELAWGGWSDKGREKHFDEIMDRKREVDEMLGGEE